MGHNSHSCAARSATGRGLRGELLRLNGPVKRRRDEDFTSEWADRVRAPLLTLQARLLPEDGRPAGPPRGARHRVQRRAAEHKMGVK